MKKLSLVAFEVSVFCTILVNVDVASSSVNSGSSAFFIYLRQMAAGSATVGMQGEAVCKRSMVSDCPFAALVKRSSSLGGFISMYAEVCACTRVSTKGLGAVLKVLQGLQFGNARVEHQAHKVQQEVAVAT